MKMTINGTQIYLIIGMKIATDPNIAAAPNDTVKNSNRTAKLKNGSNIVGQLTHHL